MLIDEKLLKILCCPDTKAALVLDKGRLVSTHPSVHRSYRIEEGIPILLIEESEIIGDEEWMEIMERYKSKSDR